MSRRIGSTLVAVAVAFLAAGGGWTLALTTAEETPDDAGRLAPDAQAAPRPSAPAPQDPGGDAAGVVRCAPGDPAPTLERRIGRTLSEPAVDVAALLDVAAETRRCTMDEADALFCATVGRAGVACDGEGDGLIEAVLRLVENATSEADAAAGEAVDEVMSQAEPIVAAADVQLQDTAATLPQVEAHQPATSLRAHAVDGSPTAAAEAPVLVPAPSAVSVPEPPRPASGPVAPLVAVETPPAPIVSP